MVVTRELGITVITFTVAVHAWKPRDFFALACRTGGRAAVVHRPCPTLTAVTLLSVCFGYGRVAANVKKLRVRPHQRRPDDSPTALWARRTLVGSSPWLFGLRVQLEFALERWRFRRVEPGWRGLDGRRRHPTRLVMHPDEQLPERSVQRRPVSAERDAAEHHLLYRARLRERGLRLWEVPDPARSVRHSRSDRLCSRVVQVFLPGDEQVQAWPRMCGWHVLQLQNDELRSGGRPG